MSMRALAAGAGAWLVDITARSPRGVVGRRMYGGAGGAPRAHHATFDAALHRLGSVEGERCLEIGCGGGALLERLLAQGPVRAAALDHSPDMLALAAARNHRAVTEDVLELELGDAATIPWPDGAFDAAVAVNMFFFVDRPQQMLNELARVLRPGGRAVIATAAGPLPKPSAKDWWVYFWGPSLRVHSDAEMHALFDRAGFTEVTVDVADGTQMCRGVRP
jgi:SAM-dependent methyltransferase